MKKLFYLVTGAIFCLYSGVAQAQKSHDLQAIENYLNSIKNMEADFVQTSSNGGTAEGKIYIAKPNKIRMEYDDPTSVLIVGDGNYIIFHDKDLDQVTHIDYDDIPASLILANDIKIDGKNIKATNFYQDAGITSITLDYKEKGDVGPITLTFANNPLELKQWKITDPQNIEVKVSLYNIMQDVEMKDSLFKFKNKKSNPLNYKKKK